MGCCGVVVDGGVPPGAGAVTQITSTDGSVAVTNGTGPIVDLSVAGLIGVESVASADGTVAVTNGAGPNVDLSIAGLIGVESVASADGSVVVTNGGGPNVDVSVPLVVGSDLGDLANWDGSDWSRLAPAAAGRYLQTQGSGAPPQWVAIEEVPTGTAQGDVLYWSGAAWTVLAPGSAGEHLRTNGAGANPTWATAIEEITSVDGTVAVANGTGPTADLSIAGLIGVESVASTDGSVVVTNGGGPNVDVSVPLVAGTDLGDLANWDGSDWSALAAGNSGQYLQTQGAGATPQWVDVVEVPGGTVANSSLRWSGAAWVEDTTVLLDGAGDITQDAANAAHTLGDNSGSPTQTFLKSETGDSVLWWLNVDSTPSAGDWRDRHASNETRLWEYYDGAGWLAVITGTSDVSLAFLGGASGAATIGYGNFVTPANVTHYNFVGAAGTVAWAAHNGTNSFDGGLRYAAGTGVITIRASNADVLYVTSGGIYKAGGVGAVGGTSDRWSTVWADAATFTNTLTLDAASPVATFGSGAGSPTGTWIKADAGTTLLYFLNVDGTPSAGDFAIAHTSIEDLRFSVHDGTAFRQAITISDENNLRLLLDAQDTATLWLGNDSQGVWTYEGVSGGNVTHIYGKSAVGTTDLLFRSVFNAETDGDHRLQHGSGEAFRGSRYDGVGWREWLGVTDDTAMTLLAGAQGSSTVTIGGTVNATDEAVIVLNAGSTGQPAIHFDDVNSRIQWDASALLWQHYVEATQELAIGIDAITMLSTVNGVVTVTGSLDAARYVRGLGVVVDGDIGSGPASTLALTNVTEAVTSGALSVLDCALGLTGNNEGYVKVYIDGDEKYMPYWGLTA